MVAAIILAAGASQRLGQPKALIPVADSTLIAMVTQQLRPHCSDIIIVTRNELLVDIMLAAPETRVIANPHPEKGRTGTLQVGLLALEIPSSVLVVPIDRPGFTSEVVQSLLENGECARPVNKGRGGHPILLDSNAIESVLAAEPDDPLRELCSFRDVKVMSADFSLNVDTPEDLAILEEWYSSQGT